ncbi:hypothetical protein Isop_0946 [Isosphaera pallida ATCC 43644]|uniref:Uncharacterized protein n=1 Tax=Isosphaera pallida (strain ATCC 43644 / DSM 9630 / IS1B) TaxID=575540 RepID=E8R3G8_ISOPI|nr:hypothetical protein Isop_0946 [Isosphaera pallida ATCC 43644]
MIATARSHFVPLPVPFPPLRWARNLAFSQERVVERNVVYSNGAPMLVQEGK